MQLQGTYRQEGVLLRRKSLKVAQCDDARHVVNQVSWTMEFGRIVRLADVQAEMASGS
jgi:hypothetical protein